MTGFRSRIGVPSTASRCRTLTRSPSIDRTSTSCRPIGFGRSAERVLNTPRSGLRGSSRGCTRRTSRRARSSQVRTMTRAPGTTPSRPSSTDASSTRWASGAPSGPCLGASAGSVRGDSTHPIGISERSAFVIGESGTLRAIAVVLCGPPWSERVGDDAQAKEGRMAENTLSILTPSVNNLTARIFVRAAGLDFEETDVWGQTTTPEFLAKDPAHLTPLLEESGLPRGSLWESCAIMQYLCNKHGLDQFYPTDPGERAMVDSAMFYLIGTLYPLVARATYPTLGFPQYPGEVATSDADDDMKARAQKDAEAALAEPLEAYHAFFLDGRQFIGGDSPSIADIRLVATLEFLKAIDYDFPAWATEYMSAVESVLGDAYSEPAADVRSFVASVKSPSA